MFTRLRDYLDERLGWSRFWDATLNAPLAGGAHWFYALAPVAIALFLLEAITGIGLMMVYSPSSQSAWASIQFLEQRHAWGGFIRGVHHWGAQTLLVVLWLMVVHGIIVGAYRRPREFTWWFTLGLAGLGLGAAHTGAMLPWDQRAYWITQVEAGIASGLPVVGPSAQRLIQGGRELGTLTLTRFYALHVGALPLLIIAVIAGFVAMLRKHGHTLPLHASDTPVAPKDRTRVGRIETYWPSQAVRDTAAVLLVTVVVVALARKYGAPLDAPADPDGEYPARPEWYLMALFKLRKMFPTKYEAMAAVGLPGVAATLLVALPFLDWARSRRSMARIVPVGIGLAVMGSAVWLTAAAMLKDARDPVYRAAVATAERAAARSRVLASTGVPPEGPGDLLRTDPAIRPRQLFEEHCAACHAAPSVPSRDAHGERSYARAPALDGFGSRAWARALLANPDADALFGRTDIHDMTSQTERLGPDGVDAVVEYLYGQTVERDDPAPDPALQRRGSALYFARCTVCHQGAGDTSETDAADRDAPDLTGWGSRRWIRDQIQRSEAPENYGTRNHMPSFTDRLNDREVEWVVDYVRELRRHPAPPISARAPSPRAEP